MSAAGKPVMKEPFPAPRNGKPWRAKDKIIHRLSIPLPVQVRSAYP